MPLCGRRSIIQATAAGGGIPPQFPGDGRGGPPQAAGDLPDAVPLGTQQRDLLPIRGYRPEGGFDDDANPPGGMLPASRNQRVPTAGDTPATDTASSLDCPCAIAAQNCRRSSRCAAGGRPGDRRGTRPDRSDRRFCFFIATSFVRLLRRPLESAQYVSIKYTEWLTEAGVEPSVGSVGDSFDNAP